MGSSLLRSFHLAAGGGSPRPAAFSRLFSRRNASWLTTPDSLAQQVQALLAQVSAQGDVLNELISAQGGSALARIGSSSLFSGSVLGGVAKAATSGFSWSSVLSDIFPVGGLISSIAGLFGSAPAPPPLEQYAAPPSLNFNAVLGAGGQLFQGAYDASGQLRAGSPGLDLVDAAGGPASPYTRAASGALVPTLGDPASRYSGTLYGAAALPSLVPSISPAVQPVAAAPVQTAAPVSAPPPAAAPSPQMPDFDQQWFNDRGSLIASAVRDQLLNLNSLADVINDL